MWFIECLDDCGLVEAGYYGNRFTWCNNRGFPKTIWKRLDRLFLNSNWVDELGDTTVQHLARVSSDHAPLLITIRTPEVNRPKYFKFLDFWIEHEDFKGVVAEAWQEKVVGNAMWILHQKLKKVCQKLSCWSRQAFGDIYEEPKRLEKEIEEAEYELTIDDDPEKRSKINLKKAQYLQFLKLQDSVLQQKAKQSG